MAGDLAATPARGCGVQLCGDAHLSNFGVFAAPDRSLVFDLNDFDETLPGPWEWDVKRLAASIEVAGRDRGLRARAAAPGGRPDAVRATARRCAASPTMANLDVWYARVDVDDHGRGARARAWTPTAARSSTARLRQGRGARAACARSRSSPSASTASCGSAASRRCSSGSRTWSAEAGRRRPGCREELVRVIRTYEAHHGRPPPLFDSYRLVDVARKVVGVGSVGTRAWVVLLLGRDDCRPARPAGQGGADLGARAATLGREPLRQHGRARGGGPAPHAGRERHVPRLAASGQRPRRARARLLRAPALGRQGVRRPRPVIDARGVRPLRARRCGWTLARAHARSGDRVAIASYLGGGRVFDDAIAEFAELYADQNERDYATLKAAADDGRIPIETGV